jgi:hypothetical protein
VTITVRAAASAVAIALAWPSFASAQVPWITPTDHGFEPVATRDPPISVGGAIDLSIFGGSVTVAGFRADATSLSGRLSAAVIVASQLEVGTAVGFTWGEARTMVVGDDDGAAATNPSLYGAYLVDIEQLARVRAGLGVGFPLDRRDFRDELAALYGAATWGLESAWLWAGDRFSLVPFASIEAVPVEYLYLAGSLHLGILIPTAGMDTTDVDVQVVVAGGVRWGPLLAALRFRLVWFPTDQTGPEAQTSLEPFVRGTADFGEWDGFAELRLTMNLDDPWGFAFDTNRVWGIHLAAGASW